VLEGCDRSFVLDGGCESVCVEEGMSIGGLYSWKFETGYFSLGMTEVGVYISRRGK
jgi:hypothetical protein